MNRLALIVSCAFFLALVARVSAQTSTTAAATSTAAKPVAKPMTDAQKKKVEEAQQAYDAIQDAYLGGKWEDLKKALAGYGKYDAGFTPQQRHDITYIQRAAAGHCPPWWQNCRSSKSVSFTAQIWGRDFSANYEPSEELGMQAPVGLKNGKLVVIVTWRPEYVDSTKPLQGDLAVRLGLTQGDLGETIVWHELGHNYITNFLPIKDVIALYNDYSALYAAAQEFYADLTALYHESPRGRLACMALRLEDLETARSQEPHFRAAYAIGAMLLSNFLSEPQKWPSIHFPPKVPEKDVERNTIIYVYENLDAKWTLTEDRALRDLVWKFITTSGQGVLQSKGKVPLAGKLAYELMATDDRDSESKRNAWVEERLKKMISSGRADTQPATQPSGKPVDKFHRHGIVIPL
jgi:hypothetical protein